MGRFVRLRPLALPMPFDPQSLADEAALLRRLAHRLIPDPHAAEDATQSVALAWLQKRPVGVPDPRAWWIAALRLERLKWLERKPRRIDEDVEPEQIGDVRRHDADPDARELRDRIERETRALREPYGSVVYAALFEERPLDEIARRLGRPHATVRSQHVRGLELLRERLDRGSGSRRAWVLVLAPHRGAGLPHAPHPGGPWTPGGLRRALAWLGIPVAATGLALWLLWSRPSDDAFEPPTSISASAPEDAFADSGAPLEDAESAGAQRRDERGPDQAGPAQAPSGERSDSPTKARTLPIRAVDPHGVGIRGAVVIAPVLGQDLQVEDRLLEFIEVGVTDASGFALVAVPRSLLSQTPEGQFQANLQVQADGRGSCYLYRMTWPSDPALDAGLEETWMVLHEFEDALEVRVQDADGNIAENAEVVVRALDADRSGPHAEGMEIGPGRTSKFGVGRDPVRIRMPRGSFEVFGWAPGRGISFARIHTDVTDSLDLPAPTLWSVRGHVLDAAGKPLPDVAVWQKRRANFQGVPMHWIGARTDESGAFELQVEAARLLDLWAGDPGSESHRWRRRVELQPGLTEGIEIRLTDPAPLSVRLVDENQVPLRSWEGYVEVLDHGEVSGYKVESDDDGRVVIPDTQGDRSTLAIYGPIPYKPPARLVLRELDSIRGELQLVVPNADLETSCVLGAINTPGWTPTHPFELKVREPDLFTQWSYPLGPAGSAFAVEGFQPGKVELALGSAPALFVEIGQVELPAGGFHDLGEVVLNPPARVQFVDGPESKLRSEVQTIEVKLRIQGGNRVATVLRMSGWPGEEILLLAGQYEVVFTDLGAKRHDVLFQAASGESLQVPLVRKP